MLPLFTLITLSFVFANHCNLAFGQDSALFSRDKNPTSFLPKDIYGLSWAQYSPWFAAAKYKSAPPHCKVTQVNLIERHGARFPTSGAGKRIQSTVDKLKSATELKDKLAFVKDYTYDLGVADLLPLGAYQAYESGKNVASRYDHLVKSKNPPFVRASDSVRVVDSATNFTHGLSKKSGFDTTVALIISEELNNTLDDAMCPKAGNSDEQNQIWYDVFGPPIATRLNEQAPGANITANDVYNLMSLCPFDSLANEKTSPFCDVFTKEEFESFEYAGDLDKYYNTGYGQPIGGRIQGVGYINELIARLTGTPVRDNTQTNRTLDSSPDTFPLDRAVYADFSHDNQMIAIYAAMGLFPQASALDPTTPNPHRDWRANNLVPFSANMVTEKLYCTGRGSGNKDFVRVMINDAVQPLKFCGGDKDGLCQLQAFVDSQSYSRNDGEGDFEKCFN